MKRTHRGNRGLALVSVLWVSVLLALIAASFTKVSVTEVNRVRNITESAKAEALAEAGVEWALAMLVTGDADSRPRTDGSVYRWSFGEGRILISVVDEAGKLDLNEASDELLTRLFAAAGASAPESLSLAAAVLDYRDADDTRRPNGAEAEDYATAGLAGLPKNGPFDVIEELRSVAGMTPSLYREVSPSVTVHSGRSEPAATPATELLRKVMGEGPLSDATAWQPLDPERDPGDAWPSEPEIIHQVSKDAQPAEGIFAIRVEALSQGGANFTREVIVEVGLDNDLSYRIKAWRRGDRRLFALPSDEGTLPPVAARGEE
jgi:general secretion pathway protein K